MRLHWLALFVCISIGCQAQSADTPTMFRGGPDMAGNYGSRSANWIDGVRFTVRTGGPLRGAPAVYRGTMYFGSADGNLYAVDAKTGVERWRFNTAGAIVSSPAASADSVYFASRDGSLYCLDTHSGKVRWKHRFAAELGQQNYWDFYLSSPTLADGKLFIGSGDGHVYAFDPASGSTLWSHDAGSRVRSTVAVHGGLVVYGTMSGHVQAIHENDGSQAWTFATEGASRKFEDKDNDTTSVFAAPTIAGANVVVGGRDGFVYGIDLASGKQAWRTTHNGSSWILSTAFDGENVFVGSGSAYILQAADPATGAEKWRFTTRSAVFGSPTVAGDTLLFTDFSGTLYALDRKTGARLWTFPLGGFGLATPVVADGIVYCGSDTGVMYALSMASQSHAQPIKPRRIVYWEGMKTPKAFSWFANSTDVAVREQLVAAGYEWLDATQLEKFMRDQLTTPSPSVVVFADNKIPDALASGTAGTPLIRKYLDAGGKIALLGPNPLAFKADPVTGDVSDIDFKLPSKVFDLTYPDRRLVTGSYASHPTADGQATGLRTFTVSSGPIDAGQNKGITVLATDEFGKASEWIKNYGGAPGTGLLQLAIPTRAPPDMAEIEAAIEAGVTW
jgi:outer membrane protein assembly factor BamB